MLSFYHGPCTKSPTNNSGASQSSPWPWLWPWLWPWAEVWDAKQTLFKNKLDTIIKILLQKKKLKSWDSFCIPFFPDLLVLRIPYYLSYLKSYPLCLVLLFCFQIWVGFDMMPASWAPWSWPWCEACASGTSWRQLMSMILRRYVKCPCR